MDAPAITSGIIYEFGVQNKPIEKIFSIFIRKSFSRGVFAQKRSLSPAAYISRASNRSHAASIAMAPSGAVIRIDSNPETGTPPRSDQTQDSRCRKSPRRSAACGIWASFRPSASLSLINNSFFANCVEIPAFAFSHYSTHILCAIPVSDKSFILFYPVLPIAQTDGSAIFSVAQTQPLCYNPS